MTYTYSEIKKHKCIYVGDNILIHIGHFKYSVGVGPIEIKSFEDGLSFGEELKKEKKNVKYRLLVDDIGITPEKRIKIKESFRLPKAYIDKLDEHNLKETEVDVIFESSMRNKASRILSDMKIPGKEKITKAMVAVDQACEFERCVPQSDHSKKNKEDREIYSIIDPYSGIPLILKEGSNPKCNLIIACSYYKDVEKYNSIISFYNAYWEQRMQYGAMVAKLLFNIEKPIIDFYYYEVDTKPKMIVHHKEEFEKKFSRKKTELIKKLLQSNINQEVIDNYVAQIESTETIINLENISKSISNLCNI